jgi:glutaredoxin-related protein
MNQSVVLYSTGCPKCNVMKMKLNKANIPFVENTNVDEMISIGLKSAPALKVDDELMTFADAVKWIDQQKV